jgi:DAACS family dicarboxylate/amino acid:cation (Na+ or H+) symporter
MRSRWSLASKILAGLLAGACLGLAAGWLLPGSPQLAWATTHLIQPFGKLFLRIIFMIVIPLIVAAIVLGVAEMGDLRRLGRVGLRSLWITLLLAGASVAIGLLLVNWLQPGRQLAPEKREQLAAQYRVAATQKVEQAAHTQPLADTLLNLVPHNPLAEAVNAFSPDYTGGGLLAVMVFSLFFGVAMACADKERVRTLTGFFQGLFDVCMIIIGFAMKLAPLGVGCLTFAVTAQLGLEIVRSLGFYTGVVVLGLALQMLVVYPLVLRTLGGKPPVAFFRESRRAIVTAFGTASSNATLPVSLRVADERLGLPPAIARFVLTVGASANQNGTALYGAVTVLFLAQVFGLDLTVAQQVTVAVMCLLAGIGTAGVPGGSLPLVVGVLVSVGVPGESIAIILGIDRFLDMCRTTLNVTGDLVCAVVVAHGESGRPAS